jgi:hypothetical protein
MATTNRAEVESIVHQAIDELNLTRPAALRIAKDPETALVGAQAAIDSLELVTLLHQVETEVSARFGVAVALTESPAVFERGGPLTQLGLLIDHLARAVG